MRISLLILVLAIIVVLLVLVFSKSRRMLESWALENNHQILSSEIRWLRRGPFFWTTSKNQVVYYVTVRIPDGTVKSGWVRCGSWWWGVFQDRVDVRWRE